MKQFFFKLFSFFFQTELDKIEVRGMWKENQRRDRETEQSRGYELSMFIGHPVICFSNEIENFVVGFAIRLELITQAKTPVLVVKDYVTDTEVLVLGQVRCYDDEFLKAVMSMERHALHHLLYGQYYLEYYNNKQPLEEILTYEQVLSKLHINGFFFELNYYNDKRQLREKLQDRTADSLLE